MTAEFLSMLKLWEIVAIPVIFLLGTMIHFFYDWSGRQRWAGAFGLVRESVWEHEKMLFWPVLVYALVEFFYIGIFVHSFWLAKAVSLIIGMVFMIVGYYGYKLIIKPHCLWANILLLLVSVAVTQHFSFYFMEHGTFNGAGYIWGLPILAFLAVLIIVWSFFPPRAKLFQGKER